MTQFAMPMHVIPTCIIGCNGEHLRYPEYGPGECQAYTRIGTAGLGEGGKSNEISVGLGRWASPADGAGADVHIGVTILDPCFTPEQARELAALLIAAADMAARRAAADAAVHASWFTAQAS